MKNIWKLLMIALLAFAMIGCPATKEEDDDDNGSGTSQSSGGTTTTTTTTVPSSGDYVFYADLSVDSIATAWGGSSENPQFTIFLCSQSAKDGLSDGDLALPQESPAGLPSFQIKMDNNLTFKILDTAGVTGVYDSGNNQYICGMAAEFDGNGRVKVYVDYDNVLATQLYCLGEDFTGGEISYNSSRLTTKPTINKANLIACSLSLEPTLDDTDVIASFWNADLIQMKKADKVDGASAFPATVDKPALPRAYTLEDIDTVVGTLNGWNNAGANLVNGVFTLNLTDATADAEHEFKFCNSVAGWSCQCGPNEAMTTADVELDAEIPLKKDGNAKTIKYKFEKGNIYTITYTYDVDGSYCVISKQE